MTLFVFNIDPLRAHRLKANGQLVRLKIAHSGGRNKFSRGAVRDRNPREADSNSTSRLLDIFNRNLTLYGIKGLTVELSTQQIPTESVAWMISRKRQVKPMGQPLSISVTDLLSLILPSLYSEINEHQGRA